jgi:voltage-gated potassium channel
MSNIPTKIGLAGVGAKENATALVVEKYFQVLVGMVALWLLVQWGLENTTTFSLKFIEKSNWIVWTILLLEFFTLLLLVEHKSTYIKRNWLNLFILLICFPPVLFHGSIIITVRILRLFILLRFIIPTYKTLVDICKFNSLGYLLLAAVGITLCSGVLISLLDPAIQTPWDGIWLAWETVTTVGYGDIAPSTASGRLVAVLVMLFGSVLFSILTANLAAYLISKSKVGREIHAVKHDDKELMKMLSSIQDQLTEIKKKMGELEQDNKS